MEALITFYLASILDSGCPELDNLSAHFLLTVSIVGVVWPDLVDQNKASYRNFVFPPRAEGCPLK